MRIILCGAGQVGYGIARRLSQENHDVTVIDQSAELIRNISERLDVRGLVGHGSHPDALARAGAREADMVIAVTFSDEVNMVACQVCHSLFSVPMKVARVRAQSYRDPTWRDLFSRKNMPIDVVISPEIEVGDSVLRQLRNPGAFDSAPFAEGRVQTLGVRILPDCPVINTPLEQLSELFPSLKITIVGVLRSGKLFRPDRSDQLLAGDDAYIIADTAQAPRALDIFGHAERQARRVIIIGAGNIGSYVASVLEKTSNVKIRLIESNKKRAEESANLLTRSIVLHGSGLDQELLREAGVAEAETVVAVTNDDQVNILAAVIAKNEKAERSIALINKRDYAGLMSPLGIDAFVDPRASTVSTILEHVRRGRIKGVYSIADGEAEILDAIALETSPLVGVPLREAKLPESVVVGAVVRGEEVMIPDGDFVIQADDRVVLFTLREHVKDVEQMFRVSLEYF